MRSNRFCLAAAMTAQLLYGVEHAQADPRPRMIEDMLHDRLARSTVANGEALQVAPGEAVQALYSRYEDVLRESGADISIHASERLTVDLESLATQTPDELLGTESSRVLRVHRQVLSPADEDRGAVRYVARLADRPHHDAMGDEQLPLPQQIREASKRDGEWRDVDVVTIADVVLTIKGETVAYRSLLY